ncbi:MAG TPA: c-type cytochrome biogenesis protein CcsB [bacterium]|nr:c-type cytochrome biogenesis protein CcsB [bacterium]
MIHANIASLDGSLYFAISLFLIALSFAGYLIYILSNGKKIFAKISLAVLILTFALQTFAFTVRWLYSYKIGIDMPPLVDLYDSLVLFSYVIILGFILLRTFYDFDALGLIITFIAGAALTFATFSPLSSSIIEPGLPALKSYWILYHILALFLAYGAFATSCGLGVLFLIKFNKEKNPQKKENRFLRLIPSSNILDEAIYKTIIFGFLLDTIGNVIGAAWADNAWGGYWSWDPKETWALVTWLIYALFLHAKITRGWTEKRMAWIAVIGFFILIFAYLGVDILLPGLHSYAS